MVILLKTSWFPCSDRKIVFMTARISTLCFAVSAFTLTPIIHPKTELVARGLIGRHPRACASVVDQGSGRPEKSLEKLIPQLFQPVGALMHP